MASAHYPNQSSLGSFGGHNSNNTNPSYFPNTGNQMGNTGPPMRTYPDYRPTSGPSIVNAPSSVFPPSLNNTQTPIARQVHTFNDYNRSSNTYGRSEETCYGNYGQQNQMQSSTQVPWHGSARGSNNNRGHGNSFSQTSSIKKQPGSTFSYRSASSNNNNNNNSFAHGRGASGAFGNRR